MTIDVDALGMVGATGGTHVADSFVRSAEKLGLRPLFFDADRAWAGGRLGRSLSWHVGGRRPLHLNRFSQDVAEKCAEAGVRIVIAASAAPLTAQALARMRESGIVSMNFSTDDPWNPALRSRWHLQALPFYDRVFTPRRANMEDLERLGCARVHYLPFGYDEALFGSAPTTPVTGHVDEVLFVGGADRDRLSFMAEFVRQALQVTVVGGYWRSLNIPRVTALGTEPPEVVRALTRLAKVNLCLVRRANRDGHCMRSFEIPATGGFMVAEDTKEHREIFGSEGACVLYFKTPAEAADKCRWAIARPAERERMARSANDRIQGGKNSYRHRLQAMLETAQPS